MVKNKNFYIFRKNFLNIYFRKNNYKLFFISYNYNFFKIIIIILIFLLNFFFLKKKIFSFRFYTRFFLKNYIYNRLLRYKKKSFQFVFCLSDLRNRIFFFFKGNQLSFFFFLKFYYYSFNFYLFLFFNFNFIFFFKNFIFYHVFFKYFILNTYRFGRKLINIKNSFLQKKRSRFDIFEYFWIFLQKLPKRWKKFMSLSLKRKRLKYKIKKKYWKMLKTKQSFLYLFSLSSMKKKMIYFKEKFFRESTNKFFLLGKGFFLYIRGKHKKKKIPSRYKYKRRRRFTKFFKTKVYKVNTLQYKISKLYYKVTHSFFKRVFKRRKFSKVLYKKNKYKYKYKGKGKVKSRNYKKYIRIRYYGYRIKNKFKLNKRIRRIVSKQNSFKWKKNHVLKYQIKKIKNAVFIKRKRFVLSISIDWHQLRRVLTSLFLFLSDRKQILNFKVNFIFSSSKYLQNLRSISLLFLEFFFFKNIINLNKKQRIKLLFKLLNTRKFRRKVSKSFYRFLGASNVVFKYFIPKVCLTLLKAVYKNSILTSFYWLFNLKIPELFSNIFLSNIKFLIKFTDSENINKKLIESLMHRLLYYNPPINKHHYLKEICDIFFLTGITKDVNMLHTWIIKKLSVTFYKKHRALINFLKIVLDFVFFSLCNKFNIKGFLFTFRGKIGQVGSVRKKAIFIKKGVCSLTNLNLKVNSLTSISRTDTGAIGVMVSVFYKNDFFK